MKDYNHINLQWWMVDKLKLKGNELMAFALIYGFSQDEKTEFRGSFKYISSWLGCSRRTAINVIDNLVEKGFVLKRIEEVNDVRFNRYSFNSQVVNKFHNSSENSAPLGSENSAPNNTNNTNNTNIPSFEVFKSYALESKPNINLNDLELKYKSWLSADWCKSKVNNKGEEMFIPIKNWKTTLLQTLPYIRENKSNAGNANLFMT